MIKSVRAYFALLDDVQKFRLEQDGFKPQRDRAELLYYISSTNTLMPRFPGWFQDSVSHEVTIFAHAEKATARFGLGRYHVGDSLLFVEAIVHDGEPLGRAQIFIRKATCLKDAVAAYHMLLAGKAVCTESWQKD